MPKQTPEDAARHDYKHDKEQDALTSVTIGSYKYNRPSENNSEAQRRYDAEYEKAEEENRE